MAIAIRGALDAATARLRDDAQFEIDGYTTQIATVFELATRVEEWDPRLTGADEPRSLADRHRLGGARRKLVGRRAEAGAEQE
jgi:hypothetical protein